MEHAEVKRSLERNIHSAVGTSPISGNIFDLWAPCITYVKGEMGFVFMKGTEEGKGSCKPHAKTHLPA